MQPPSPCVAWGEEVEESGWREGGFSMLLVSHCPSPLVIGNKLQQSPYAESVFPMLVIGEQSPCP